MTFQEFDAFQEKLLAAVVLMKDTKGKEYAHSEDRFANFRRLAEETDTLILKVAYIFFRKHLDSIISYIKDQQIYSTEPIQGRFVDAITYLTLMAGIVEELESAKRQ